MDFVWFFKVWELAYYLQARDPSAVSFTDGDGFTQVNTFAAEYINGFTVVIGQQLKKVPHVGIVFVDNKIMVSLRCRQTIGHRFALKAIE